MKGQGGQSRRAVSIVAWLFAVGAVAMVVALALLALLVWQQARQVGALRSDLEVLQNEREALQAQLVAMESRLTAQEARSQALEAGSLEEMAEHARDLADLRTSLEQVAAQVEDLQAAPGEVSAETEAPAPASAAAEPALPPEVRLPVARQRQSHNLSCESSAVSMVADYLARPLSEAEVLQALPLDENPHRGFRGNVDGSPGGTDDYGVYAGPILDFLQAHGFAARLVEGGLAGIRAALARGSPVIAWVTYNCQKGTPVQVTIDGEVVTLVPYQHVVVVTGYDDAGVWANDPWDGQEDFYVAADFERAWGYFDNMAIEVAAP